MRPHLTFANVTSVLALFFALGGSAYAISVSGDDVVNNSLSGKDLRNNSVKPRDVAGLGANVTVRSGPTGSGTIAASSRATCNPGETLVSGGYGSGGNQIPTVVTNSPEPPSGVPTAWQVLAVAPNPGQSPMISVTAFAICAS